MVEPLVRLRGVAKTFGSGDSLVRALTDIDLEVAPGERLVLMGPSGCGKTTLLSLIAATLVPDAGTAQVCGRDLAGLDADAKALLRRDRIGFVFQAYHLVPALSARENAAIPLVLGGTPWPKALAAADAVLASMGLADKVDRRPNQLSGGQQQRVAIARALVHDPVLILADEPTSALDHTSGAQVMDLLAQAAARPGRAVIVVTHDPRLESWAHRVVHLDDGRISRVNGASP